jgi:SAM-dependent methyltransferase
MPTQALQHLHARYVQQARWTRRLRQNLLRRMESGPEARVLEVGVGTGAVLTEFTHRGARLFGVEIEGQSVRFAKGFLARAELIQADGLQLPLADATFHLAYCHFFLLWVADPLQALREMARVVRPGGWVAAFAEPDYGGRIDYPPELEPLGQLQRQFLEGKGADPLCGRKLRHLFQRAGLVQVEAGLLGGQWRLPFDEEEFNQEWQTLRRDLMGMMPLERLDAMQALDRGAWMAGERILFVPTFYAVGQVIK